MTENKARKPSAAAQSTPQSYLAMPTCRAPLYLALTLKDIPELENLSARKKLRQQLAQSQG